MKKMALIKLCAANNFYENQARNDGALELVQATLKKYTHMEFEENIDRILK